MTVAEITSPASLKLSSRSSFVTSGDKLPTYRFLAMFSPFLWLLIKKPLGLSL
jgi:hypothetical protein